jgi:undecaprenyl-diphosphatase
MAAATLKTLYSNKDLLLASDGKEWMLLAIGNLVAFVVAYLAIKSFIGILTKYGFRFFGYYRIIVGTILLILIASGFQFSMF